MNTTGHKKDGDSMCLAFETMVDNVEKQYKCIVVAFITDNNGGSCSGRTKLVQKHQWIFGPPCCAHQVRPTYIFKCWYFNSEFYNLL